MRPKRGDDKEVPKVLKNKKGELGLISLLALIFSSVLFVSAGVINSTNNSNNGLILNNTLPNISANTNITLINDTTNLPIPIYNVSLQNKSVIVNENISRLAKIFNEDNLDFDREFRDLYLAQRKNFSDLPFKNVTTKENARLLIGSRNDNIKGYEINNTRFAIDLLGCNSYSRYCTFRINGVPTKQIYSPRDFPDGKVSFDLDGQYVVKIENIVFDYCDGRRFCHLGLEGYHVVDVSIERKR